MVSNETGAPFAPAITPRTLWLMCPSLLARIPPGSGSAVGQRDSDLVRPAQETSQGVRKGVRVVEVGNVAGIRDDLEAGTGDSLGQSPAEGQIVVVLLAAEHECGTVDLPETAGHVEVGHLLHDGGQARSRHVVQVREAGGPVFLRNVTRHVR